jgi:hypothetical protein
VRQDRGSIVTHGMCPGNRPSIASRIGWWASAARGSWSAADAEVPLTDPDGGFAGRASSA